MFAYTEMKFHILLFYILLSWQCRTAYSHGRLLEPPSRASAWRKGFNSPTNTNDMGLNCGGLQRQIGNNGKCGLCGDAYDGAQHHMAGGQNAPFNRPIVRCFERSQTMNIEVEITASHMGYFEFRLCENNDMTKKITQECLNQHLLTIHGTSGETRFMEQGNGMNTLVLDLPDIICQQCVLQWLWHTGNGWGCDPPGYPNCGKGKGPQEEFVGCADIEILEIGQCLTTQAPPTPGPQTQAPQTWAPPTQAPPTWAPPTPAPQTPAPQTWAPPITQAPQTWAPPTPAPPGDNTQQCRGVGVYTGRSDIDQWCNMHCPLGHCPPSHCACGPATVAPPTNAPTIMPNPATVAPPTNAPTIMPNPNTAPPSGANSQNCIATGNNPGQWASQWCNVHCSIGYCPPSLCSCVTVATTPSDEQPSSLSCEPSQAISTNRNSKQWKKGQKWCMKNCTLKKGNCPESRCNEDCRILMYM